MEAKRVLVVDDNANIRAGLRHFLEAAAELEVCGEAADGLQAIEQAIKQKPAVILMDLSMPNLNGAEAASVIRHALPDTRIVIFTLFSDSFGRFTARLSGVDVVLSKSEGLTGLTKALQGLFTRSSS